ncbi:MAG: hypothetical protein J3R72DRAFT_370534 [Linnemannia gamsii]|nr:MAG: hypothetical protein J3R72DRAFT_370534 [Linnemannia gamsii]
MTFVGIAGCVLRRAAFAALGRFFTYQFTVRSSHQLIQTGPYTFLRHPGYTGYFLSRLAIYALLWHEGLWDVFSAYLTRFTGLVISLHLPLVSMLASWSPFSPLWMTRGFLGVSGGLWVLTISMLRVVLALKKRVECEEQMLRNHFGKQWDEYASQRWAFIPFMY